MLEIFYHPLYTSGISKNSKFPRDRYRLIFESISNSKANKKIKFRTPEKIDLDLLYNVHQKKYVDNFIDGTLSESKQRAIGLRPWTKDIVDRTLFIMGGGINALDSAIKNGISSNLAGGTHHAHYDYGSGYCIFNDIALTANYCKNKYKEYQNILVLDLDVHQGDGSATMLKDVESVFTFSMHCGGNFPLKKQKSDLDVELEKGTGDEEYIEILKENLYKFKSIQFDIVFFQAGVDSLKFDSLGHLNLTQDGMKKRNELVLDFCATQNLPLLIFMGGGYSNPIDHTVEAFHNLFVQCTKTVGTIKS